MNISRRPGTSSPKVTTMTMLGTSGDRRLERDGPGVHQAVRAHRGRSRPARTVSKPSATENIVAAGEGENIATQRRPWLMRVPAGSTSSAFSQPRQTIRKPSPPVRTRLRPAVHFWCDLPNTSPVADNAALSVLKDMTRAKRFVELPDGCINSWAKSRPLGRSGRSSEPASCDPRRGDCVQSNDIMRRRCEYAKMFESPYDHVRTLDDPRARLMNEGQSTPIGLPDGQRLRGTIMARKVICPVYWSEYSLQISRSKFSIDVTAREIPRRPHHGGGHSAKHRSH